MQKTELQAIPRSIIGKKVKSLRRDGFIPCVIYGHDFAPVSIQVQTRAFAKAYAEAGESTIVYVNMEKSTVPTIIHDVAVDPISDAVLHVDFYKVRLDEKIHARIPLEFAGEAPAVK